MRAGDLDVCATLLHVDTPGAASAAAAHSDAARVLDPVDLASGESYNVRTGAKKKYIIMFVEFVQALAK